MKIFDWNTLRSLSGAYTGYEGEAIAVAETKEEAIELVVKAWHPNYAANQSEDDRQEQSEKLREDLLTSDPQVQDFKPFARCIYGETY
jgi:hypothetical protein